MVKKLLDQFNNPRPTTMPPPGRNLARGLAGITAFCLPAALNNGTIACRAFMREQLKPARPIVGLEEGSSIPGIRHGLKYRRIFNTLRWWWIRLADIHQRDAKAHAWLAVQEKFCGVSSNGAVARLRVVKLTPARVVVAIIDRGDLLSTVFGKTGGGTRLLRRRRFIRLRNQHM